MKKFIRFFRNKEDMIPLASLQLAPAIHQTNDTFIDAPSTIHVAINEWMNNYANGKVDFVWLP